MDSYFGKQSHQVDMTLYAQNNGNFFLNGSKIHCGCKLVYLTIVTNKVSYSNIFLAWGA